MNTDWNYHGMFSGQFWNRMKTFFLKIFSNRNFKWYKVNFTLIKSKNYNFMKKIVSNKLFITLSTEIVINILSWFESYFFLQNKKAPPSTIIILFIFHWKHYTCKLHMLSSTYELYMYSYCPEYIRNSFMFDSIQMALNK